MTNDVASSSSSINKTIKEIDTILDGADLKFEGPLREKLRKKIIKAMEVIGTEWYSRGFKRGHLVAAKMAKKTDGKVPKKISIDMSRKITKKSKARIIKLRSKIK